MIIFSVYHNLKITTFQIIRDEQAYACYFSVVLFMWSVIYMRVMLIKVHFSNASHTQIPQNASFCFRNMQQGGERVYPEMLATLQSVSFSHMASWSPRLMQYFVYNACCQNHFYTNRPLINSPVMDSSSQQFLARSYRVELLKMTPENNICIAKYLN